MRSGDGIAAGDQAFQGKIQARGRHQSRLFLRTKQLGGVSANPVALRRRGGNRRRTMAEGRHHGPDLAYRGAERRQAGSDFLLDAVCRFAGVHEAGKCSGPVRRRQAGVAGGRMADQPAQEGIHAGRRDLRTQHALFRSSAGVAAAKGVRRGLQGPLQGSAALGGGPGLFRAGHLQGRRRSRAKGGGQMADGGAGGRGHAGPGGRKPRRQGPLPQGQDRRAGLLSGAVHQQRTNTISRRWLRSTPSRPNSCKSRRERISGSGSRPQKCRSEA